MKQLVQTALHVMKQLVHDRSLQEIQHTKVQKEGGSKPSLQEVLQCLSFCTCEIQAAVLNKSCKSEPWQLLLQRAGNSCGAD